MKLELKVCKYFCSTEIFAINDIEADSDDFGEQDDIYPGMGEDYGCGNMQFTGKPATEEILEKYHINLSEYNEVVENLTDKLSFGGCHWCS